VHIALHGDPSQSYRASLAIWDHTLLPATRHKWTHPTLTPSSQAGRPTRFTYPGGMKGWVNLGSLIATPTGESNPRPLDRKSDALTVMPPSHQVAGVEHLSALYVPVCVYVCMSALLNKNLWRYHQQTWQVDSTSQILVTQFIWGQKVKWQSWQSCSRPLAEWHLLLLY